MVSPEVLRSYSFFGFFSQQQYMAVAMISQEVSFFTGEIILREGQIVDHLYFLMEGCVELNFAASHLVEKEVLVGEINPGEPFGISSLIYPYLSTATVGASKISRAIQIDAVSLRQVLEQDYQLGFIFMTRLAQAAISRLYVTRIQLAAERMSTKVIP